MGNKFIPESTGVLTPNALASDSTLLSEADALLRWPALSKAGLRAARQQHRIAWVKGKRGSAWYRPSAIETFIKEELEQPCHDRVQGSFTPNTDNGLHENLVDLAYTGIGMTPELEERAARRLAQKISKPPKRDLTN